ncbi:SNARE associated Golgi protein family isoform 1 [Hibiscus syriacus]|uniref:SNARE associated Golgi protein family isoform 1 n=1 Tax=Hibiscus syriacus TaxID=106335 RepID=A0A6A2YN16_HIBSY|nr:SNARE associated Golgi protein family isoform 1 [Hibiscus syriacus]
MIFHGSKHLINEHHRFSPCYIGLRSLNSEPAVKFPQPSISNAFFPRRLHPLSRVGFGSNSPIVACSSVSETETASPAAEMAVPAKRVYVPTPAIRDTRTPHSGLTDCKMEGSGSPKMSLSSSFHPLKTACPVFILKQHIRSLSSLPPVSIFTMAVELQKTAQADDQVPVVNVTDVPQAEKTPVATAVAAKEPPPVPESDEEPVKPKQAEGEEALETKKSDAVTNGDVGDEKVLQSGSYKEESTRVADLVDNEKKASKNLKCLFGKRSTKHEFFGSAIPPQQQEPKEEEAETETVAVETKEQYLKKEREIPKRRLLLLLALTLWKTMVPRLSKPLRTLLFLQSLLQFNQSNHRKQLKNHRKQGRCDERSDVILLKFLRTRDFKMKEAFTILQNTIRWRKQFGIDELVEQDLGDDLEKVYSCMVWTNKDIQCAIMCTSIRKLDSSRTIVQINDLKNSPELTKWEHRQATKQALQLLQDNYPEFVARQVFVNVPWWYLAVNKMISPFLTQRTRSKFVFAGPSRTAETLFKYIAAEQVPVKYGGLNKDGEFADTDAVIEETIKPAAKHTVEWLSLLSRIQSRKIFVWYMPVPQTWPHVYFCFEMDLQACFLTWEVRVVEWDVSYGAEFVPSGEDSYTIIIQKSKKVGCSDEQQVVCNNFKAGEPGKVVLTIDNPPSKKKKKLIFRLKTMPSSDYAPK